MRRADHLQCRRGRWSVRLRVPAHLVATVGQTHLVRSLDTSSEAVARERRWVALALLWEWIGAQTVSDGWKPAWAAELTGAGRSVDETARKSPNRIHTAFHRCNLEELARKPAHHERQCHRQGYCR